MHELPRHDPRVPRRSRSSSRPTSTRCRSSSTRRPAASTRPSTRRSRPPAGSPSADPNLQNIPIRTPEGRRIREAFVAEPGCLLLSADYSQIELRVLAHLSKDATLIDTFREGRGRPRPHLARDLRPALRGAARTSSGASRRWSTTPSSTGRAPSPSPRTSASSARQAEAFIEAYFARYPDVRGFIDETIAQARETGSVRTLLGRLRRLPDLRAKNFQVRAEAERQAMNTPVQGSAADLIKQAMIDLHERAPRAARCARGSSCRSTTSCSSRCPRARPRSARALVKQVMEGALALDVPARRRRPARPQLGRGALSGPRLAGAGLHGAGGLKCRSTSTSAPCGRSS